MSAPVALEFLLVLLAKVTLLFGLAAIVDVAVLRRHASAAARHMLWTLAVVASLLVPVLGQVLPAVRAPLLDAADPMARRATRANVAPPNVVREPTASAAAGKPAAKTAAASVASRRVVALTPDARSAQSPNAVAAIAARVTSGTALLIVYLVGALFVLLRIAVDHAVVWRIARNSQAILDASWTSVLLAHARRLRVRRPVLLLRSQTSVMPLTFGFVRPRIVVPRVADEWSAGMREAVVMHELAHIARADYLTQSLAAVACALFWPTPLVWWAAARLRVERELACDDLVLARGVRPHDYAAHLLDAARVLRTPRLAVSMAAASGLERRLRAVIDDTRRRDVPSRRSVVTAATMTLGVVSAIAAVRPVRVEAAAVAPLPRVTAPAAVFVQPPPTTQRGASAPAGLTPKPSTMPVTVRQTIIGGSFSVRLSTPADGPANTGRIHMMLQTPGLNTFYEQASRLDGLRRDQFAVPGAPLRFRLRRDAGTFDFTGVMRNGYGAGRFEFTADPAFADSLARRGIGAPSADQQFSIARHDVSLAFVDELITQGYTVPTIAQLVRAGTSGADLAYVREMAALGYREQTVDAIIRLSNQGVDPPFVRELAALGYRGLRSSELVALSNHSVDAAVIKEANARAGRTLTARELVQYRNRSADAITAAPAAPAATPTPPIPGDTASAPEVDDPVVNGRWTIAARGDGWLRLDIEWANVNQWQRFVRPAELAGITPGDIDAGTPRSAFRIEQDAGVFSFTGRFDRGRGSGEFTFAPNQSFPATLRALGVREAERVGIHQLKNLAFASISAAVVREFMAAGLTPITLDDLVGMAIRQVTPGYVRELRAAGVVDADSAEAIMDLRIYGVPAPYATELSQLGYRGLTHRQLIELHRAAVTTDFIRQQQASGRRDLTPEELIDLRRRRD